MSKIVSKPDHGSSIGNVGEKKVTIADSLQLYFDDITTLLNTHLLGQAVVVPAYTVATAPDAATLPDSVIIVTNEAGGRTLATSNGVDWLRVSDGLEIS